MESKTGFRFSANAYGYDVIWRDSARWLGFVWKESDGWHAQTAAKVSLATPYTTRNDAARGLFDAAED